LRRRFSDATPIERLMSHAIHFTLHFTLYRLSRANILHLPATPTRQRLPRLIERHAFSPLYALRADAAIATACRHTTSRYFDAKDAFTPITPPFYFQPLFTPPPFSPGGCLRLLAIFDLLFPPPRRLRLPRRLSFTLFHSPPPFAGASAAVCFADACRR